MRKLFKKILVLPLAASLIFGLSLNLEAKSEVDFSESDTVKTSSFKNYVDLGCGVDLYQYDVKAYNDGIVSESRLNDYIVSWFDYGTNDVRVVNWTSSLIEQWSGSRVTALANKYEETHPGYLVIGGVNGDFFRISDTCEVKNVSMQEGNLYKALNWGQFGTGVLGWTKDGHIVSGTATISPNMYVEILDEVDNITSALEISSINNGIAESGISLLSRDVQATYDFTDCNVVEVTYSIHRFLKDGNSKNDKLYILGDVSNISNKVTETYPGDGTVYLVAKDNSLDSLQLGDHVRCQYHLTGDWADVYNTTGYYAQILKDGESLFKSSSTIDYSNLVQDKSYINCLKNRTVIGERADGTTVLMTVEYNKSGNYGASYYECAEYLRSVGCINGWLLDGGGSTTLAVRTSNGSFKCVGGCSDGDERSDGNAVLLVVKDPGIRIDVKNSTRSSATISIGDTGSQFRSLVNNIKVSIGDDVKEYTGEDLVFEGLEEDTLYEVKATYTLTDGDKVTNSCIYQNFYTMSFGIPFAKIEAKYVANDAVVLHKTVGTKEDVGKTFNYKVKCGDKYYDFEEDSDDLLITGLSTGEQYRFVLEFDCTEKATGNIYHGSSEPLTTRTLNYNSPLPLTLTLDHVDGYDVYLKYEYYDSNDSVTEAYIDFYGDHYALDGKQGTVLIEDVDVYSGDWDFSLVLKYGSNHDVSLDYVLEEMEEPTPEPQPGPIDNPDPAKKGKCGKKNMGLIISLIALGNIIIIPIRKYFN